MCNNVKYGMISLLIFLFLMALTPLYARHYHLADDGTSITVWTTNGGAWTTTRCIIQQLPAPGFPGATFAAGQQNVVDFALTTFPLVLQYDVYIENDTATGVEDWYGVGLLAPSDFTETNALIFALRNNAGSPEGLHVLNGGTAWIQQNNNYNWVPDKWYKVEIILRNYGAGAVDFEGRVWRKSEEYRPATPLIMGTATGVNFTQTGLALYCHSSDGGANGGGIAKFDNVACSTGPPEPFIGFPINDPVTSTTLAFTVPIVVGDASGWKDVQNNAQLVVEYSTDSLTWHQIGTDENGAEIQISSALEVTDLNPLYTEAKDDGWTVYWDVPTTIGSQCALKATLVDTAGYFGSIIEGGFGIDVHIISPPEITSHSDYEEISGLETFTVEAGTFGLVTKLQVRYRKINNYYRKGVPLYDQLIQKIRNVYGTCACVPTAIASCINYWGDNTYSSFDPGPSNPDFKDNADLVIGIAEKCNTSKQCKGTLWVNGISGTKDFIDDYYPTGFFTNSIWNRKNPMVKEKIDKGEHLYAVDDIVKAYRDYLEIRNRDVIVCYNWSKTNPDPAYYWNGHAVTGNGFKNTPNVDSTLTIEYMDAYGTMRERNLDSEGKFEYDSSGSHYYAQIRLLITVHETEPKNPPSYTLHGTYDFSYPSIDVDFPTNVLDPLSTYVFMFTFKDADGWSSSSYMVLKTADITRLEDWMLF